MNTLWLRDPSEARTMEDAGQALLRAPTGGTYWVSCSPWEQKAPQGLSVEPRAGREEPLVLSRRSGQIFQKWPMSQQMAS